MVHARGYFVRVTNHIYIYGEIGTKTGQVSQKSVKDQIMKDADDYVVHVFSPGGDVFEGYGIFNVLKNDTAGKPVTAHIEGLCASIATLVVTAAQKIIMNRTGQFMIHNPHISDFKGDANALRQVANQLDQIKTILINSYKERTGLSEEKLWELYDNETYLTADQAAQLGFIDESVDAIKAAALDINKFTMKQESILSSIRKLFTPKAFEQFKNEYTETLADGTVVIVQADTEDWTGAKIILEDGSPVPAGDYELASGKMITVDDTGAIAVVTEAEAKKDDKVENSKIKELEDALVAAQAALDEEKKKATNSETVVQNLESRFAKFEAKMKDSEKLQSEYLKLKEEHEALKAKTSKTFGDNKQLDKGPAFKSAAAQVSSDPMGDHQLREWKARGIIRTLK